MLTITVDASRFKAAAARFPRVFNSEIKRGIKQSLTEIQREARRTHRFGGPNPRRTWRLTGNLARSVTVDPNITPEGGRVYLETGIADYGPYIHEGFRSWRPDRFLLEAGKKMKPTVLKIMNGALQKALKLSGLK